MSDLDLAQKILDGRWMHAARARDACRRGAWAAFVRDTAPKPPSLFGGRGDYRRCLERAEASLQAPSTIEVVIVPLWVCSTEDDTSTEWVTAHGLWTSEQTLSVKEVGPHFDDAAVCSDAMVECTVRAWRASTVVESRSYSPEIPLEVRAGAYGVLAISVDEVISVKVIEADPIPRPAREVPMFASWFEPRVQVAPALGKAIRELSFTASDED